MTSGLVARGKSDASLIKSWGKDVVPFFLHEWMSAINTIEVRKHVINEHKQGKECLAEHDKSNFIHDDRINPNRSKSGSGAILLTASSWLPSF